MKPAIEGGKPVRKDFLTFGKPMIRQKEIKEVLETLRSGWWGTGKKTKLFEEKFKKFINSKYALALNSCTAGLHLALNTLGIGQGDEVITTPLTFVATANVIVHCGAKPVFADINKNTWNIEPLKIEETITKKTKAIIPVHLHGRPCQMDQITKLAKKNNLYVVEDAAHAIESVYKGRKIGTISDFTAFSFYATKNLATGEGGMLTTNKKSLAEQARIKSLHGISKDAWKRYSSEGFQPYEAIYPGFKYNMMDLQAALGIHQLGRINKNLKIRKKFWQIYNSQLQEINALILPQPEETNTCHGRHLFAVLIKPEKLKISRNQFIDALTAENIGVGIHFTSLHLQKYYQKTFNYRKGDYPQAEFVSERTISLPLSAQMSSQDVQSVIRAVKKIVKYYYKK
jgi:dTDP-4-amino-4,6-dideoxygalactose transaminase